MIDVASFVVYLDSNLVSWFVKKQSNIAQFSTESEYSVVVIVTTKFIWLQSLLKEFDFSSLFANFLV